MLLTPLQLAHAIATLSARGTRYQPRMVRAIRNVRTGQTRERPPVVLAAAKTADRSAWDVAIAGMIDVINAPYGTARSYQLPSPEYKIAGKSGSVQVFSVAINERVRKAGE